MARDLYFMSTVNARDTALLPIRQAIVAAMGEHGTVLDAHIIDPAAYEMDQANKDNGVDICARDYGWLDRASAGVAEFSVRSIGAGMEAERFSLQGKPLLVLHKEGTSASLAGFLPNTRPNVTVHEYRTIDEAVNRTHAFLHALPPQPFPGKFIVIDGPDYCGKGTQHRMLVDYLMDHPRDRDRKLISVFATREPFNTSKTLVIRDMLQNLQQAQDGALQLAQLFTQDRFMHASIIRQLTASGVTVASDRYKYSTLAYQSAQGVPMERLLAMHEGLPVPDLTFFVMTPLAERLRRKAAVRDRPYAEVFEKDNAFQAKLQQQYEALIALLPREPIVVIDGQRPVADIQADIRSHVDRLLFG